MEVIDKNTWVLEPELPTFNAVYRRIAISNKIFLLSLSFKKKIGRYTDIVIMCPSIIILFIGYKNSLSYGTPHEGPP